MTNSKIKKVEFYKHGIDKVGISMVTSVLRSLFISTGKVTDEFEKKFASMLNAKYAVGLSSCTDALFLSLKYFNLSRGDEVITTPLSFISTANVIEHTGATPIFVDVDKTTGNIDLNLIEKSITKKTRAIIVVHLYGQMVDMIKVNKIAKKFKLIVIEDSAHCIEGEFEGIKPGMLSDIACFSFYATKNITSGEGGAIVTNNKKIYEWFLRARLHGMSKNAKDRYTRGFEHYDMDFLGYKSNMTDIQASLLLSQLLNIKNNHSKRLILNQEYKKLLSSIKSVEFPQVVPKSKSALHLFTILVNARLRNKLLTNLSNQGIGVAVNFRPIHLMHYYKEKYKYKKGSFPVAEEIGSRTISLPFYPKLKKKELALVVDAIKDAINLLSPKA